MARVLVTGSAGTVGQAVCRELAARGHALRGLDRVPTPGLADALVADVAEPEAARAGCAGMDAVVHLAAYPNDAPFSKLVGPNVLGLHAILDAAREERVRRVVLASTLMIVWHGRTPAAPARVDEAHPANHYALTKLWAEQMGEMYARAYEMSVLALRLTWMVRNPAEARQMQAHQRYEIYVSRGDAGRAFAAAVEAPPDVRFAVAYVSGPDGAKLFDLEPGRRFLGWEPRDRWPAGLPFALDQDGDGGGDRDRNGAEGGGA